MSEILDWINKHKLYTLLIIVSIFLIFFLPIHILIYMNSVLTSSFFDEIGLSTDSLITYIAGFEAFVGTFFLGIIALRQNEKANDLNKRMLENEEKRDIYDRTPRIKVTAGEISHVSLGTLEDMDIPYYSYANIFNTRGRSAIVQNKDLYLQKIYLLSTSYCDIHAKVKDFHLLIFDTNGEDIAINYKIIPEQNFPVKFLIHSDPYEFYFIHNNLLPEAYPDVLGELSLILSNFAGDQFLLCIKFKLTLIYSLRKLSSSKLKIIEYSTHPILE